MKVTDKSLQPDNASLRKAFQSDLAAAWRTAREKYPQDTPYAFALYGVEGTPALTPHVLTEESLTEVAQRYVDQEQYDLLEEARRALRYSVSDSPRFYDSIAQLPTVTAITKSLLSHTAEDKGYELLAIAAMGALASLDRKGVFGTGSERNHLILIVITEDTSKAWAEPSARKLNPPAVFKRYQSQTKRHGFFGECDLLATSADGRSIYSSGDAMLTSKRGSAIDLVREIVAYDIKGSRFVRRWSFPIWDRVDKCLGLCVAPDCKTLFSLQAQDSHGEWDCILRRFDAKTGEPIGRRLIHGRPASLAMSADGSRLAVGMQNRRVEIVDAEFNPLFSIAAGTVPQAMAFIDDRRIVIGGERALLLMNISKRSVKTIAKIRARRISLGGRGKLLAASPALPSWDSFYKKIREAGVQLFSVPACKAFKSFLLPGHESSLVALSNDGERIAFYTRPVAKRRGHVVMLETKTGRKVRPAPDCAESVALSAGQSHVVNRIFRRGRTCTDSDVEAVKT